MSARSVSRSEFYDLVWDSPIQHVASSYGISDVGLAKICRKHDIPRPPRGYWAKKQHGQSPKQIPLPDPERNDQIDMPDRDHDSSHRPGPPQVEQPEFQVNVAEHLRTAHPLVSKANQELSSARVDDRGIIDLPAKATLKVMVSRASQRRALLIMDALIKALEANEFEVLNGPRIEVDDVTVKFNIYEQVEVVKTPAEDHDLSGSYTFGHSRFNEKRRPTGRLGLELDADGLASLGCQRNWRDTKRKQLEHRLGDFLAGVVTAAAAARERQEQLRVLAAQREEERQREAEREKRRLERRALQKEEQARVEQLLKYSSSWNTAKQLREYVEAARKELVPKPGGEREFVDWIEWALEQADRIDPLRDSPQSILDEDLGPEPYSRRW